MSIVVGAVVMMITAARSRSQVGPYTVRVDAVIGEGGFATIYRVQDQTTSQVRVPDRHFLQGRG